MSEARERKYSTCTSLFKAYAREGEEREILGENLRLGEDMLWDDSLMVLLKQLFGCFLSLVLIFDL